MSQAVQIDTPTSISKFPPGPGISRWSWLVLALLLGGLYGPILARLASQWWNDPNFSHGPFVPLFSLYVLWQDRDRLRRLPKRPSWSGALIILLGLGALIGGIVGAELFLSRASLLIVLAGLVVLFLGWNRLRAVLFPWAFLLLMIPIPKIIFNEITIPLQKFASVTAAHVLPNLGVPVYREGNIINLPAMPLEVAEACSGIRSLMSLATLAIIYGYFMEPKKWIQFLLAVASVPIAVAANAFRIIGTGLLVQYWDPEKAEGFFHTFSGWLIFMVSLVLLLLVHRVLVWADRRWVSSSPRKAVPEPTSASSASEAGGRRMGVWRFATAVLLLCMALLFLQRRAGTEVIPERASLTSFPMEVGDWGGRAVPIEKGIRDVLGPGDFMLRVYEREQSSDPAVDLFVAYFPSQRSGDTMHSPQNCLPGAGWNFATRRRIELSPPGVAPFVVNQNVVAKGTDRQLVLYWYYAHDRAVASEYSAKWYLISDAMRMNRSDGSLIRITTPMLPGETIEAAMQRLRPFADEVVPKLPAYIPK